MLHQPSRAFTPAPLSRTYKPVVTQVIVAELLAAENENILESDRGFYFAYCRATRSWHIAQDFYCTRWESPEWSVASECDVTPMIYRRVIETVKRLTEQSSPSEQRRCLSHGFASGVVKLLMVDARTTIDPWELNHPPKPVREKKRAERDAAYRAGISDMLITKRSPK